MIEVDWWVVFIKEGMYTYQTIRMQDNFNEDVDNLQMDYKVIYVG